VKIPSSKVISYINIICEIYKLLPPILICEKYLHKRLTDKLLEQVVQAELVLQESAPLQAPMKPKDTDTLCVLEILVEV
jgi:hypothetical protein